MRVFDSYSVYWFFAPNSPKDGLTGRNVAKDIITNVDPGVGVAYDETLGRVGREAGIIMDNGGEGRRAGEKNSDIGSRLNRMKSLSEESVFE